MLVIYPYPEELPSKNARSIQVLNTVCSLGKRVPVFFYPARMDRDVYSFYGLERSQKLHVRTIRRKWGPFTWTGGYMRKLIRAIKEIAASDPSVVVYTRHLKVAYSLLRLIPADLKLVYEVHELFSHKNPKIGGMEKYVFEHVDGLVFISRGLKEVIVCDLGKSTPHCVVPSGVSMVEDLSGKDCSKPCSEVYYVGSSRYEWKGMATLLEAMLKLEGVRLKVIGDIDAQATETPSFRILERDGKISVSGYIPPFQVREALREATIGILPTTGDRLIGNRFTSPLKLLEYMAAKIAIVASDLPSTREMVTEKEAMLIPAGDSDALANGIKKLIGNPTFRESLAQNAYERAKNFTWEKRAEKIISFLGDFSSHRISKNQHL